MLAMPVNIGKKVSLVLVGLLLSGCGLATRVSGLRDRVADIIVTDATRGAELANKYGAPEVASCLQFVSESFAADDKLLSEDTSGLLSLTVKLYLLRKQAGDNAVREQAFKEKCGPVTAGLMLEMLKQARSGASRGMF